MFLVERNVQRNILNGNHDITVFEKKVLFFFNILWYDIYLAEIYSETSEKHVGYGVFSSCFGNLRKGNLKHRKRCFSHMKVDCYVSSTLSQSQPAFAIRAIALLAHTVLVVQCLSSHVSKLTSCLAVGRHFQSKYTKGD